MYILYLAIILTGHASNRPGTVVTFTGQYHTAKACTDAAAAIQKSAGLVASVAACTSKG